MKMKITGTIIKGVGYIQGMFAMFYFGIVPAIGGVWTWSDYGLQLVLGLVGCVILVNLGEWIKNRVRNKSNARKAQSV